MTKLSNIIIINLSKIINFKPVMNPIRIIPISNLITQKTFECVSGLKNIEKQEFQGRARVPRCQILTSSHWKGKKEARPKMLPLPSHVTAVLIYLEPGKYDQPLFFCQKPTLVIPQLILFSIPFQVKWQFCCWGKSNCSCVSLQHLKPIDLRKWPGIRLTFSKVFRTLASDWRSPIHRNWCLETRK